MASICNNYEINIAKDGKHWGKVELPDVFPGQAEEKLKFLRELFGKDYHISMIYWVCDGRREDSWK